jgi:hypothetical protein
MPPIYVAECTICMKLVDYYRTFDQSHDTPDCSVEGHGRMRKIITPPMVFVQPDYRYESPVDGHPITNYHEHLEELARTDTVVYEPGIKQDQERNERKREEALDRAIDETVECEIATMSGPKREKLAVELEGGSTAEAQRITPAQKSFRDAK